MRSFCLIPFALVVASAVGCSKEENATVEVGVSSNSSALTAESDVPADTTTSDATSGTAAGAAHASAHVRVTVKEIRLHVAGDGSEDDKGSSSANGNAKKSDTTTTESNDGAGWVTVFSGSKTIELDRTTTLDSVLGKVDVPAGKITQIRLVLDGQATLVEGGQEKALACGSCDTSGLKIVPKNLRIDAGDTSHLLIAIDLDKSLVDEGGALRLKPVVRLARGN